MRHYVITKVLLIYTSLKLQCYLTLKKTLVLMSFLRDKYAPIKSEFKTTKKALKSFLWTFNQSPKLK